MKMRYLKHIGVISSGLLLIIIGILCLNFYNGTISSALFTAGISMVAIDITSLINDTEPTNKVVEKAYQNLKRNTKIVRDNQRLKIFMTYDNSIDMIVISAFQEFDLKNANNYHLFKFDNIFTIYTDIGRSSKNNSDGFQQVKIENEVLSGKQLRTFLREDKDKAKTYFTKPIQILQKKSLHFEISTEGYYNLNDQLIWTVQNLSEDFDVQIYDKTNLKSDIKIKINHHNEDKILPHYDEKSKEYYFNFNSEILPYQGFELMWFFRKNDMEV